MFCENCGEKIPNNAKFCVNCGKPVKTTHHVANEKNMLLALLLSMLLMGLGLCYACNKKKGIILFVVIFIFNYLRHASVIFFAIAMILWAYALYETYREVKIANGDPNPNLIEDIQTGSFENIAPLVAIVLLLVVYYFVVRIMFY